MLVPVEMKGECTRQRKYESFHVYDHHCASLLHEVGRLYWTVEENASTRWVSLISTPLCTIAFLVEELAFF